MTPAIPTRAPRVSGPEPHGSPHEHENPGRVTWPRPGIKTDILRWWRRLRPSAVAVGATAVASSVLLAFVLLPVAAGAKRASRLYADTPIPRPRRLPADTS